jgi:hypothetical protein
MNTTVSKLPVTDVRKDDEVNVRSIQRNEAGDPWWVKVTDVRRVNPSSLGFGQSPGDIILDAGWGTVSLSPNTMVEVRREPVYTKATFEIKVRFDLLLDEAGVDHDEYNWRANLVEHVGDLEWDGIEYMLKRIVNTDPDKPIGHDPVIAELDFKEIPRL